MVNSRVTFAASGVKTHCEGFQRLSHLPFSQPHIYRMISEAETVKRVFVYLSTGKYFLTVDRKWSRHWRISRLEAFRVRAWYTLWAMLRRIAWNSWNRICKKRHTRNRLFALKMDNFRSLVSAFRSGSFQSREKWKFLQIRILYRVSHVEER